MKKILIIYFLCFQISAMVHSQNLIRNAGFEEGPKGKFRADCAADGCFNGNVPHWYTDDKSNDSGIQYFHNNAKNESREGVAYSMDGGPTYQIIGLIDARKRTYTLSYHSLTEFHNDLADTSYTVTTFYSYSGNDSLNRTTLDVREFLDSTTNVGPQSEEVWHNHTYSFTVPKSEVGKKLIVGFDAKAINRAKSEGETHVWIGFDDFELTVEETSNNAENLINNPGFEEGPKGKFRADCADDGCFNGNVPYWYTDNQCTDTGIMNLHNNPLYPSREGVAYSLDGGPTYQIVDRIAANKRTYTFSYQTLCEWHDDLTDTAYTVTTFYSYSGTDSLSRTILDIREFLDSTTNVGPQSEDIWHNHTYTFTVPESEVGKKLILGFDVKSVNRTKPNGGGPVWIGFDNFVLMKHEAITGISSLKPATHLIDVFPNPSNGKVYIKCPDQSIFEVYDFSGKLILSEILNNNDILDLSRYNKGIYILRIKYENNKVYTSKIIIQ